VACAKAIREEKSHIAFHGLPKASSKWKSGGFERRRG
jgi:hypothetical protein